MRLLVTFLRSRRPGLATKRSERHPVRGVLRGGGKPAGRYGAASRRSFVLHVLDELIHHGAEAALLRDLYAATSGVTG